MDGTGLEYEVRLGDSAPEWPGTIVETRENTCEPAVSVTVFPAVLKAKKLELLAQKCTEIGVSSIAPIVCERSVVDAPGHHRIDRLSAIVREAAEQSGRGRIPSIADPVPFRDALDAAPARTLVFAVPGSTEYELTRIDEHWHRCRVGGRFCRS